VAVELDGKGNPTRIEVIKNAVEANNPKHMIRKHYGKENRKLVG